MRSALPRTLESVGVDFDQWKALTTVGIKLDILNMRLGNTSRYPGTSLSAQIVTFALLGLTVAVLVWMIPDLLLVGTLGAMFTMTTIGIVVLLEHNSIVSPLDYAILAHHPVSSRTYFAARLANALAYTTALTTIVISFPVVSLFLRHGAAVAGAGVLAFFGASMATTLAILMGYATVLRVAGPERVQRMLSYAQLAMSFVATGAYLMGVRHLGSLATSLSRPGSTSSTPWLLLLPPAWFGAYLKLASREIDSHLALAALASLALIALLAGALGSRLTLDYSQRLAETMATAERGKTGRAKRLSSLFGPRESRAVALLVRSQFKNDLKFRLAILAVVPITVLYCWYGATDGSIRDPFLPISHGASSPGFPMITFAIVMFPLTLKAQLAASDAFRASWIFFASPTDRMRIVRSAKNVVTVLFLLPYLVLVTALVMYVTGSIVHVAIHMMLVFLLSHFALQLFTLMRPELPFSRPLAKGQTPAGFFGFMMGSMMFAFVLQGFSAVLYSSLTATIAAFASVIAASVLIDRLTQRRVARDMADVEFGG